MIEITDLEKNYGETTALRRISVSIQAGEVVGLLGPNGAGKTTAMKILVGYLLPTSGTATVAGHDVIDEPLVVQSKIGYLPENAPLYGDMLVQEYLRFMADMRGLEPATRRQRFGQVVDECCITDVLTRPIGQLSKGFRQRVGLAGAILHDPEILILDEPTTGLDPNQIVEVRDLIRRMGQKKTIILSTHILPEVEASCGRAVILIDGRVRADGSLEDLTRSSVQSVTIAPDDPGAAQALFSGLEGVTAVERHDEEGEFVTFHLRLAENREMGETVSEIARARGWRLRDLHRNDKSLEQVFRELTETGEEVAA
ncbi:MAG: ATP-binding cassette domain-containing protein [Acidobacteriota bacterium]